MITNWSTGDINQKYPASRTTRSLEHLENIKTLSICFENSSTATVNTGDKLTDIFRVDVHATTLLAVVPPAVITGNMIYVKLDDSCLVPMCSKTTMTFEPTGTLSNRIPIWPGLFLNQNIRFATYKNGEGTLLPRIVITVTDDTGLAVPVSGKLVLEIESIRWQ